MVIVPVLVTTDNAPDYRSLAPPLRSVDKGIQNEALVIVETTLPVGATRNHAAPIVEHESGLVCGGGLWLAVSPERLFAGRVFQDLVRYPKIVGGVDDESTRRAVEFYRAWLEAEGRP